MKNSFKRTLIVTALILPVGALALWPAFAQPAGGSGGGDKPAAQPGGPGGPGGGRGQGGPGGERRPRSEHAEKYQTEMREHPSLGRALVAVLEAKDYLDKAPGTYDGKKADILKSMDDTVAKLKEAIKHDPKREPPAGGGRGQGRPGGPGGQGGQGGDGDHKPDGGGAPKGG